MLEQLPWVQALEPLPTATEFFGKRLAGGKALLVPKPAGPGEIRRLKIGFPLVERFKCSVNLASTARTKPVLLFMATSRWGGRTS